MTYGRDDWASANRHGLDHDRASDGLWTRSDVTVGVWKLTGGYAPLDLVVLNEEDGMKAPCAVNLHNAVTVSQQRLGKRVAQLSSARMNEVCAALRFSLGCDSN
jgi:mRNA-degrading endonuclease toxin of MazEF toxin-antitoxin module